MANSLNHSKLKKRITMMQKRKSNPWARAKYLYVLPLAAVAVAAFARPEISGVSNQLSDAKVTDLAAIVKAKSVETLAPQDSVYDAVDQPPQFPGGAQAMADYLMSRLMPKIMEADVRAGSTIVQFVVDKTGQVTDAKVVSSVCPALDAEIVRVVQSMPRWKPGLRDSVSVSVKYSVPVSFSKDKDKKSGLQIVGATNLRRNQEDAVVIKALEAVCDSPLVLVGGVELKEGLSTLDPDRIDNIVVLKNEKAVKLYGEKAAGGVILVITKKDGGVTNSAPVL